MLGVAHSWPRVGETEDETSGLSSDPKPAPDARVLRALGPRGSELSFGGSNYRLVRSRDWSRYSNSEQVEIVGTREAQAVLSAVADKPATSPVARSALREAAGMVVDKPGRADGVDLLLLRVHRARVRAPGASQAPMTPAQLARAMGVEIDRDDHWVEIELQWEDGSCASGVRYLITTPDRRERSGVTNTFGRARIDGISVAGPCKIRFPDLDNDDWRRR